MSAFLELAKRPRPERPSSRVPVYPPTVTLTQSYTWVLREVFLAAAARLAFFSGFTFRRNLHPGSIQVKDLPMLGVYIGEEVMTPDKTTINDGNAGHIAFQHDFRIMFSVILVNNDPIEIEKKLDAGFWAIMNGIWRDQYITNFMDTMNYDTGDMNPDNTRMEAITRGVRRHKFGATGLNNETPFAEMQYEVTVRYRAEFAPTITDDLLRIHVETVPMADDGTVPPADEVQRIISEYMLEAAPAKENPNERQAREVVAPASGRGSQEANGRPAPKGPNGQGRS